jgi:hypothetical protein
MYCFTYFFMMAGCRGGIGRGGMLSSGLSGGGGHGGKGGDGFYSGSHAGGGAAYGSADLPCELGSGSGNVSTTSSTAGGGIIGNSYGVHEQLPSFIWSFLFLTALTSWCFFISTFQ